MTTSSAPLMDSQCIIQPRRLIDFLQDQNLPFPHHRNGKSTIFVILRAAVKSCRFSIKNRSSHSSRSPEPTLARTTSVTVKDILRWKSFRDLSDTVEINVPPSYDFTVESPTSTATTRSAGTPTSSWSDSDFTVGDSPVWCRGFSGDIEVTGKKKFYINVAGAGDPKDRIVREEDEQFSPISVLDFTQEHEETFSSFHQTLANTERRNLMLKQRIQDFESLIAAEDLCLVNKHFKLNDTESFEIEEKAIQLMDHVKTISSAEDCNKNDEYLLLDFFRDELILNKGVKNNGKLESRVLRVAKSWVRGEDDGSLEWELEGTREVCIREMEKRGKWNDIEEEKQEIGIEIEKLVLNHLLDELTVDLLNV